MVPIWQSKRSIDWKCTTCSVAAFMIDSIHANGCPDIESMSDADCARRLQHPDINQTERNAVFDILFERHRGTVFAIVMRRLRNAHDADQVTQDVFVRFFRKIHQLEDPERFVGWLKRIAIRLSINFAVRNSNKHVALVDNEILDGAHGEIDENPEILRGQKDTAAMVRKIIPHMKVMDREVLIGFYYGGESLIDLAERFEVPVGTIKRRLFSARGNFREKLTEAFPDFVFNKRSID